MTEKTDLREQNEKVVEIEMERLVPFNNHPFKPKFPKWLYRELYVTPRKTA